jgi:hypothetical protein
MLPGAFLFPLMKLPGLLILTLAVLVFPFRLPAEPVAVTEPPAVIQKLVADYCQALGGKSWEKSRALYCINGHPDVKERDFQEYKVEAKPTKAEVLYRDADLMIVRVTMDETFVEYKPPVQCYRVSLMTVRFDPSEREEKRAWRIWNISTLNSGKKG